MSDRLPGPGATRALDALVEEAKAHLDVPREGEGSVDMDWSRLESRLASIEETRISVIARPPRRIRAGVRVAVIALAAAAAVAVMVRREPRPSVAEHPAAPPHEETAPASAPISSDPTTDRLAEGTSLQVNGGGVAPGYVARVGDVLEVATRATFERARKVTWLVEPQTQGESALVRVTSADQPLVLRLERGAVEAQVAPVRQGEAFAVDVATEHSVVRVAVHGTHLRVARAGDHVVVDLTEGVIAIGVPPRSGLTSGTIVNAPAHVELDATDLASVRVDHTPRSVRAAVFLPVEGLVRHEGQVAPPAVVPPSSPTVGLPGAPPKTGISHAAATERTGVEPVGERADAAPAPRHPRVAIAAAVRDCASRVARPSAVRVTVTSHLSLRVSAAGTVESAQFSPPLLPEIQSCAAEAIYRTALEGESGVVTIPIEYSY